MPPPASSTSTSVKSRSGKSSSPSPSSSSKSPPSPPLSKYRNWSGPFFTMLLIFTIVTLSMLYITITFFPHFDAQYSLPRPYYSTHIAYTLILYTLFMVTVRFIECGSYVFYESVWCCNLGMILVAVGILADRPALISVAFAGVSMDQLMWYVDCTSYLFIRKFPVGAAKYLVWPNTSWTKKYTCFHHLLFLPICLYLTKCEIPSGTFLLGSIFTSISSTLCRAFTPYEIEDPSDSTIIHYLNINCGYKFWRDVKIKFLHVLDDQPWYVWLPAFWVWGNVLLNGPSYLFFVTLCEYVKPYIYT